MQQNKDTTNNLQSAFPIFHNKTESITAKSFIPSINQFQNEFAKPNQELIFPTEQQNLTENEDYDIEMDEVFIKDEGFNPFEAPAKVVKKIADEFLNQVKTNFPNRFFILKRITQNAEFWEICMQKGFVIINDEASYKKLLNCIEVSIFLFCLIFKF